MTVLTRMEIEVIDFFQELLVMSNPVYKKVRQQQDMHTEIAKLVALFCENAE